MLHDTALSIAFWHEAAMCAAKPYNYTPHTALQEKQQSTPHQMWNNTKPDINRLKVFGCNVYTHIDKSKRSKLESHAIKRIFIGYEENRNAYRIYYTRAN